VRQIGRSVLVVGAALIGGLIGMVITGIVMVFAYPGTVISGCHTAMVRGGPQVCPSAATFRQIMITAGSWGRLRL
jgi:hypothetical protein